MSELSFNTLYEDIKKEQYSSKKQKIKRVEAVLEVLFTKIHSLDENLHEDAKKIIKGLAYFKIKAENTYKSSVDIFNFKNGLNLNKNDVNYIKGILNKLRELTGGQFIACTDKTSFTLDLIHVLDYDKLITQKMEEVSAVEIENKFMNFLQQSFNLDENKEVSKNVYEEKIFWPQKNSYATANIIFEMEDQEGKINSEIALIFSLKYKKAKNIDKTKAVVDLNLNQETNRLLKRLIVLDALTTNSNYPSEFIKNQVTRVKKELRKNVFKILFNSPVYFSERIKKLSKLIDKKTSKLDLLYFQLQTKVFNGFFPKIYPRHPQFPFELTEKRAGPRVEEAIRKILDNNKIEEDNSRQIYSTLFLLDKDGYIDIKNSYCTEEIIDYLQNKEKKKADIEEIISLLNKAPYGLNKELIYFLLAVLTYLGKIELLQKNEIKITIFILKTYFVDKMSLFNEGLNKMDKIKYIILREDNYKNLKCVFKILALNLDLLEPETSNHRLLLQYKNKINSLKKKVNRSKNQLTRISKNIANRAQRLKNIIKEKDKGLSDLLPRKLLNVEYISDLQNMSLNNGELEKLKIGLKYLHNFECFLDEMQKLITDYNTIIHHSDDYKQGDIEDLKKLMRSSWEIIDDKDALTSLKQKVRELSYN